MKNKQKNKNSLKKLRKARGWTTEYVAEQTGLAVGTINKLENGGMRLTADYMIDFAKLYSVHPWQTVEEGNEPSKKQSVSPNDSMTWKIIELIVDLAREHPEVKKKHFIVMTKALQALAGAGRLSTAKAQDKNIVRALRDEAERFIAYEAARH